MASKEGECRLLALPPELRNRIYEYTLCIKRSNRVERRMVQLNTSADDTGAKSVLSLLQTCRQIHDEAKGMFYSINTVALTWNDLPKFIRRTGTARLDSIHTLSILFDVPYTSVTPERLFYIRLAPERITGCLRHLQRLRKLRVLNVVVPRHDRGWIDRFLKIPAGAYERERTLMARALKKHKALEQIHFKFRAYGERRSNRLKAFEAELQAVIDKRRGMGAG